MSATHWCRYIEVTAGSLTLPVNKQLTRKKLRNPSQFKELIAAKRQCHLDNFEKSLLSLQLEQARQTDPWELITTRTLLDSPVAPNKKYISALGLLQAHRREERLAVDLAQDLSTAKTSQETCCHVR